MLSYGHKSSKVYSMNVISFKDSDHNDWRNEVNQNRYYTTENSDSNHPEIFLKLHHNNEEYTWLQDTAYCSELHNDNKMSTDQQQFSVSSCQYVDATSNKTSVTSNDEIESQKFLQTYKTPKYNTRQLQILHEIQQNTQPTYYHQRPETHRINRGIGKSHRACISVIRASEGNFKVIVKRKRTVFTEEQLKTLEEHFCQNQYVTRQERQNLVDKLKLNDRAVKIWFQNRRLKDKREQEPQETTGGFITNSETLEPYLDYIETQINERTNELGYVTLDDTLTGNLVNIIYTVLVNRNRKDLSFEDSSTETENKPIYEPVSPAEEICTDWELSEPKTCFQ